MNLYFVAKTPTAGFINKMSIDDIIARLDANEIDRDCVATESTGPSYEELVKRTDVRWEPVSQLVARLRLAETIASPTAKVQTFSSAENKNRGAYLVAPQTAKEQTFSSVENRYRDAYLVASATAAIGAAVKVIGLGLGLLIVLAAVIIGSQNNSGAQFIIGGMLLGIIVAIPIYVLGILVSAQAQVLKATLDTAVHSSPFLTKENMAKVMSL